MKKTLDLYRKKAHEWAGMSYKDALVFRAQAAQEAMYYYKYEAEKVISIDDKKYKIFVDKFTASENARDFNRALLEETL